MIEKQLNNGFAPASDFFSAKGISKSTYFYVSEYRFQEINYHPYFLSKIME